MADTQLDRLYYTVDAELGPYNAKMKAAGATAAQTGGEISKHLGKSAEGAERLHRGIEVSRRELLYFGREVATGDFARLPSTMVLIGSHMLGLTSAGIMMGGAIVGPFALMAIAAVQAEKAAERVRVAIARTGDAAGVTSSQITTMAKSLGADPNSGLSTRGAMDSMSILAGSGNVSGGNLGSGAQASAAWSQMTGQKLDASANDLAKMMGDPAKAAKELHDNFFKLSDAEMLRIEKMKSVDEQQKAIFDAINKRGADVSGSLWSLSKGFDEFTGKLANFWYNTGTMISGQKTPQERIDSDTQKLGSMGRSGPFNTAARRQSLQRDRMDAIRERAMEEMHATEGSMQTDADRKAAEARSPGAMEIRRFRDAATVSGANPRDRDMMRARLDARRSFTTNQANPDMAKYAGGIESAQIAAAQAEQNNSRRQALTLAQQSASAEENLAKAYHDTVAAGEEQNIINKAHAEFLKGAIDDEGAYADSLRRTAAAQRAVAAERKDASLATDVQALRLENSMQGQTNEAKERAIALLRMHNELQDEGWDLTTKAGQDELAQRKAIINAQQDQLKLQKDINEEQRAQLSIADDAANTLDQMMADPKNALKSLAGGVSKELRDLSINQLRNHMAGAITGEPGTLPTFSTLGNMLAGPGKRGESEGMPMFVKIVDGGGGSGGGQGGIMGWLTSMIDGRIGAATAGIQQGAVDVFSNAIGRGFTPGAISA